MLAPGHRTACQTTISRRASSVRIVSKMSTQDHCPDAACEPAEPSSKNRTILARFVGDGDGRGAPANTNPARKTTGA